MSEVPPKTPTASLPQLIKKIKGALKTGDNEYALEKAKAAHQAYPDNAQCLFLMAQAYLRAGRAKKAEAALAKASQVGLDELKDLTLSFQIARHNLAHQEVARLGKRLWVDFDQAKLWIGIPVVDALIGTGRPAEALEFADQLLHRIPQHPLIQSAKFRALVATHPDDTLLDAVEQWIFDGNGGAQAAKFLHGIGTQVVKHRDKIIALMNRALDTWPEADLQKSFRKAAFVAPASDGVHFEHMGPQFSDLHSQVDRVGIQALAPLLETFVLTDPKGYSANEVIAQVLSDLG